MLPPYFTKWKSLCYGEYFVHQNFLFRISVLIDKWMKHWMNITLNKDGCQPFFILHIKQQCTAKVTYYATLSDERHVYCASECRCCMSKLYKWANINNFSPTHQKQSKTKIKQQQKTEWKPHIKKWFLTYLPFKLIVIILTCTVINTFLHAGKTRKLGQTESFE